MRQITIIIYSILIASASQAQDIKNLNDSNPSILYRGFSNHFEITDPNWQSSEYTLACENCEISSDLMGEILPQHQFTIKPKTGKQALLKFIRPEADTLVHHFAFKNLPDPTIYLNGLADGSFIDESTLKSSVTLDISYPEWITLKNEFQITRWELLADDLKISGEGHVLSEEAIYTIKLIGRDSHFYITCTVLGLSDGITRRKTAEFLVLK